MSQSVTVGAGNDVDGASITGHYLGPDQPKMKSSMSAERVHSQ